MAIVYRISNRSGLKSQFEVNFDKVSLLILSFKSFKRLSIFEAFS